MKWPEAHCERRSVELNSGGAASLAFIGETQPCTYTHEKARITVDCKGDKTVFT